MSWPQRHLKETYTYWAPQGSPNDFGFADYAAPVLIRVRRQLANELVRNSVGQDIVSTSTFYCSVPVKETGMLKEGNFSTTASPLDVAGALEIKAYHESNDLRNASKEYKAFT